MVKSRQKLLSGPSLGCIETVRAGGVKSKAGQNGFFSGGDGMRYENRDGDLTMMINPHLHFSAHMHPHIELVLVQRGCARAWVDTKEYTLRAGDAFIVFPNQVHEYFDIERGEHIIIIFSPEQIPSLLPLFEGHLPEAAQIALGEEASVIATLAKRAVQMHESEATHKVTAVTGYLHALLGEICSRLTFNRTESVPSGNAKKVINYCRKHYREEISLEVLERELYINRYYISHIFTNYLQVGFNEYINSLRIFEACRKLRHETTGITEIAEQVGFGSLRTFNRTFKQRTGMTPSEYRCAAGNESGVEHA